MAVERALNRGNPFVEPDMDSIHDRTNEGNSVFRVRTRIMLNVEEISGEAGGDFWDWSTFYFSDRNFDDLSEVEFERRCVDELIEAYYSGQAENGIKDYYMHTLTIYSVQKYDNTNIHNMPMMGETYRVRMLKGVQDVHLQLEVNQCFWKYFCGKVLRSPGFEDYSILQLWKEIFPDDEYNPEKGVMFAMYQLQQWIKTPKPGCQHEKNISYYAWWANNKQAECYQSNNRRNDTIVLNFMITDQHILPLEHKELFTAKSLRSVKTLTKNLKDAESEINWKFDYHLDNYFFVDHDTFDKNRDNILAGTFKPDVEALVFEIRRNKEEPENDIELIRIGNDIMHHTKHKLYYANIKRNIFKHPTSKIHQTMSFVKILKNVNKPVILYLRKLV